MPSAGVLSGVGGAVVGGAVVAGATGSGEPSPESCSNGTPVTGSVTGLPRPGVGSKATHPYSDRNTSGQAWAWRPVTVQVRLAAS